MRTQIKVLELAAQELQDDFLGFHLARSFDLREIGLHYYVMASSEQLAEGLRNAERYSGPAEYKSFLASDVEFGADADEIVFPEQVASLPIVGADNYLNKLLRQYADEALADRPEVRGGVRADVERVIPQLLPHGKANTSEVARQLGLSSRTLSRALSAEGVTFGKILEEERAAIARRYLKDRELPISEIAWLLGYREISSFTNAFKRWSGMNPREFRSSPLSR